MRSLWSQWPRLQKSVAGRNVILLLDFDGTLAPIVLRAADARIPAPTRAALVKLAHSPRVVLGIVSGRKLSQLRRLVRLEKIYLIGGHGSEIMYPNGAYESRATLRGHRLLKKITAQLRRNLRGLPLVWMERKVTSVALHYRGAASGQARAARMQVARIARRYSSQLGLIRGKKVFEFVLGKETSKGSAVQALVARLRRRRNFPVLIFIGDDATDESVFARMGKRDLSIHVGASRRSRARFYLRSPAQVGRFLDKLSAVVQ